MKKFITFSFLFIALEAKSMFEEKSCKTDEIVNINSIPHFAATCSISCYNSKTFTSTKTKSTSLHFVHFLTKTHQPFNKRNYFTESYLIKKIVSIWQIGLNFVQKCFEK